MLSFSCQALRHTLRCAALLIGLTGAAHGEAVIELTNPFAGDPDAAAGGEELFGRKCQQCHNSRGKGGKGPQLVKGAWGPGGANSDTFMYRTIALGRPKTEMGSFAAILEPEEIWRIINFLREEAKRVKAAPPSSTDDDTNW